MCSRPSSPSARKSVEQRLFLCDLTGRTLQVDAGPVSLLMVAPERLIVPPM